MREYGTKSPITVTTDRISAVKAYRLTFAVLLGGILFAAAAPAQDVAPEQDFSLWLGELRAEAEAMGIRPAILDEALSGLAPIARVIELDRRQPEFTQTLTEYLSRRLSPKRVELGRRMMAENEAALTRVAESYGVQARFIVAIWGMETNYGGFTGSFPVIASLVTLAHDGRRSVFFRNELLNALKILDEGHIAAADMLGSWAGAMGQSQFMPSSFLTFARDDDGDGRADIWHSRGDVFASIANYLARNGWRDDHTWGRPVRLPGDFAARHAELMPPEPPSSCRRALRHHTVRMPLGAWQAEGLRRINGRDLPVRALQTSLVLPARGQGAAFLTYPNFRSILRYNCSNYYAIAVGTLADRIAR